jgi:membrane-bound lytic murein transglycosylase B
MAMSDVVYLPNVIKYDRFQPEFYEDTKTYISKRSSDQKVKQGTKLYKSNKNFINSIDNKFSVEKSLLLALMGIETNFGTYVGKMDILSSLATLSFDERRSEFFTSELITILQLVESGKIDHNILYGSWAGAFGNFQFMPSTIEGYAIDYDENNIIELKSTKDSFASAANYINKIGWKKNQPCFIRVNLTKNVPKKLLNTSAKKLHNKNKFKLLKKYIKDKDTDAIDNNLIGSIITPDKDIIPNSENLEPAYIVFENYEKILQWNRSLRFGLAVCTLKDKFENAL